MKVTIQQERGHVMLVARDLETQLPPRLRLLCRAVGDYTDRLHPAELALMAQASTSRKREFSTGRLLARELLGTAAGDDGPILRGPNREPLWPVGCVGSISHASGYCAAAVGSTADFFAIGLDLQAEHPSAHLESLILSEEETRDETSSHQLRLRFSMKEAIFKCLFPVIGVHVAFRDLTVLTSPYEPTFAATCRANAEWAELLRAGEGRYSDEPDAVMSLFWVPRRR